MTYNPDNGETVHQFGVVVTHSCDQFYSLNGNSGDAARVCGGNGSNIMGDWSGSSLTCTCMLRPCMYM